MKAYAIRKVSGKSSEEEKVVALSADMEKTKNRNFKLDKAINTKLHRKCDEHKHTKHKYKNNKTPKHHNDGSMPGINSPLN